MPYEPSLGIDKILAFMRNLVTQALKALRELPFQTTFTELGCGLNRGELCQAAGLEKGTQENSWIWKAPGGRCKFFRSEGVEVVHIDYARIRGKVRCKRTIFLPYL